MVRQSAYQDTQLEVSQRSLVVGLEMVGIETLGRVQSSVLEQMQAPVSPERVPECTAALPFQICRAGRHASHGFHHPMASDGQRFVLLPQICSHAKKSRPNTLQAAVTAEDSAVWKSNAVAHLQVASTNEWQQIYAMSKHAPMISSCSVPF